MKTLFKTLFNLLTSSAFTLFVQAITIPLAYIYIKHYPDHYSLNDFIYMWAVCTTFASFLDTNIFFENLETDLNLIDWISGD